jgi:hypothetical protein
LNILFDFPACRRFEMLQTLTVDNEPRSYYCLAADDDYLALLVIRGALLSDMAGDVVDCTLGWDSGYPGYVHHVGQLHSKITAFGRSDKEPEITLSEILSQAPTRR